MLDVQVTEGTVRFGEGRQASCLSVAICGSSIRLGTVEHITGF